MLRDNMCRCDHVPEIPRFLAHAILRLVIPDWFGGAGRCAGLSLMILGCWRGLVPRSEILDVIESLLWEGGSGVLFGVENVSCCFAEMSSAKNGGGLQSCD